MDVSRLKKKDLIVWLPLMEGVDVQCRYIGQTEFDAIESKSTDEVYEAKLRRTVPQRDDQKFRSGLGRAVVQDWRGITDGDDDFPCTPENIDYLMEDSTEFRLLVMDAPLSLEKMLAAERDALKKKSLGTSVPEPTTPTSTVNSAGKISE